MCQHSSDDGYANDWHFVHLGSRTTNWRAPCDGQQRSSGRDEDCRLVCLRVLAITERAMRLRRLALAFALAAAGNALAQKESRPDPTWQDEMAKGMVPYRQLSVDDFPIKDAASSKHDFYIQGAIDPQYHFIIKLANGFQYAYIDRWAVFSGLDKLKTYRKSSFKGMKAGLPFAQAILDLNEICARRLAALKPGELPSARGNSFEEVQAELNRKVKEFVDAKYKESDAEIEAFAKATDNGAKEKKVRELAAEIKKRLQATPAATVPFTEPNTAPIPSPLSTMPKS